MLTTFPVTIRTTDINQPQTEFYYTVHYDKIKLAGLSYSTIVGPFSVAGNRPS